MKKFFLQQQVKVSLRKYKPTTLVPGFSLLGMLAALMFIACLGILGMMLTPLSRRLAVRAEVDKLYALCTGLQRIALCSGNEMQLIFDVQSNAYRWQGQIEKLADGVVFGAPPQVKGPPSAPTHTIAHPVTWVEKTIRFLPDGTVTSGVVYITSTEHELVYAISSGVGNPCPLRLYQHKNNKWHHLM